LEVSLFYGRSRASEVNKSTRESELNEFMRVAGWMRVEVKIKSSGKVSFVCTNFNIHVCER